MNHGKTRATRRWLPAAALATVALVAALWAGLGRDTSETHAPELAAGDATIALPEATEAATSAPLSPLDTPSPTSLSSDRASLTLRLEADGLVAAPPYLRVTRQSDGETEMRSIGEMLTTAWPTMPAGSYTIETLDDTWVVDEPQVTLAGGEVRTVTLSSRRTAAVRVAGAFSGQLQPTDTVRLLARTAGGVERDVNMTSRDELTDGSFALFGLPAELADGSAVEALRLIATVGRERAMSDWFTPASLSTTPTVLVRMPEPVIVGRVVRESAGDGLEAFDANQVTLWMEDADAPPPPITGPHGPGVHAATLALNDARSFARVQRDGRYELRLTQLPAGPVRVVASNSLDKPATAGPFTLSAKGLPLQVDLLLPASGAVRGIVHTGVVERRGRPWAVHSLASVRTRPIGPDGKPRFGSQGHRGWPDYLTADEAQLKFLVGSLDPGEYEVAVDLKPANAVPDAAPARHLVQRVRVEAGAPVVLEFDARGPAGGATVSGSVILPAGLDPDQVEIALESADGDRRAVALDEAGRYAFPDVPPGDWIVRAGPPAISLFSRLGGDAVGSAVAGGRRDVHVGPGDSNVPPLDLTRPEVRLHVAGKRRTVLVKDAAQQGYVCSVDEFGLGRIYGLPAGRYKVVGTASQPQELSFEVTAGDAVVMVEVP